MNSGLALPFIKTKSYNKEATDVSRDKNWNFIKSSKMDLYIYIYIYIHTHTHIYYNFIYNKNVILDSKFSKESGFV